MPHATLKLLPGVDQNRTIALNEAAISDSQFIRFIPDKQGLGLVQKLGGWTKFYTGGSQGNIGSIVRALWAWEDTNAVTHLGVGCQTSVRSISSISGDGTTITITISGTNVFSTGQIISISGVSVDAYNNLYLISSISGDQITVSGSATGAATGGVIYTSDSLSSIEGQERTVLTPKTLREDLGVASVIPPASGDVVFETTAGSSTVYVHIDSSSIQDTDSVFIKTQISVGGIILFGLYQCYAFDANKFSIQVPSPAITTSTTSAVPTFSFEIDKYEVTVTLNDHGFQVGDTFTILVPLDVGAPTSVSLFGNYVVQTVVDANSFRIFAKTSSGATTAGVPLNGGDALLLFYKTPGALPAGTVYGAGLYGSGAYSIGSAPVVTDPGLPIIATDWTLDNWGEIFMSCPVGDAIFSWNPNSGIQQAQIIPNSPTNNDGIFVAMPQRQVVAWGSTFTGIQDPLLIRWSDVGDYSVWEANIIQNQAGSYRMPRGSRIVSALQGPQQGLVWTDLAVWAMQYVGPPYVYQFNEIGTGCGLIARKAATSMNGVVYWMGQSQFYKLAGSGVEIIACPVWDVIFQDLDTANLQKIRVAANSRFGEISWYYPTVNSGGEISHYVKYNVYLGTWDFGTLSRTAWINESVLGPPIGAGTVSGSNFIYQHETSKNADNTPLISSFQTGYFAISDGEYKIFVDQFWPDMKWGYYGGDQGAIVNLTFYVADYPHETPRVYGPYPMNNTDATNFITPRFRGRLVSIKMESSDLNSFWRIGAPRYRFQQDGKF